jgi:hypothetical protein
VGACCEASHSRSTGTGVWVGRVSGRGGKGGSSADTSPRPDTPRNSTGPEISALRPGSRFNAGMPELTRRRYREIHECWHVYYGDVHVGTIAIRAGAPVDVDQWGWILGFYPGTEPEEYRDGTAETFDLARADFDAAWKALLPTLTEAHYQRWRHARDRTAEKYAMWERGERLPSQRPNSWMGCPCGERFDCHDPAGSYVHRGHIYAAKAADGIRR